MAQRLNKKLVAILTITGMAITTAAAIVMVMSLPQQDPSKAAEQARQAERRGDYVGARRWYVQAYQRASAGGQATDEANDYLIRAGEMALASGNARAALASWRRVVLNDPQNQTAQRKIMEFMLELARMGSLNWAQVETEARKLLEINPKDYAGMHALGLALINQRSVNEENLEQGRKYLIEAFEGDKGNSDFANTLALHYFQEGEPEKGVAVFDELMQNLPEDPAAQAKAWRERGLYFLLQYARDGAVLDQKRRQHASPGELNALREKIRQADKETSLCLSKALELQPDDVENLLAMGRYWSVKRSALEDEAERTRENKNAFAKAEDYYKRAIHADRDGYEAYLYLAQLHLSRDNLDEAFQVLNARLQRGVQRQGYKGTRNKWYMARIRSEMFRVCMLQANPYLAKPGGREDPAFQEILSRLENLYKDQVAELREEDPSALFMKGRLLMLKGDVPGAIKAMEQASRLLPAPNPEMNQYLAQLYLRMGELGPAERALRVVLQAFPNNVTAWAMHGTLMLQLGRNDEAMQAAERALQLDPNNRQALTVLAGVYRARQNWEKLRELQQKLSQQHADETTGKFQQAILYRMEAENQSQERRDELLGQAEQLLREVLEEDPANQLALRELTLLLARDENRSEDFRAFLANHRKLVENKLKEIASATQPSADEKTTYSNILDLLERLQIVADPTTDEETKFKRLEEIIKQGEDPFLVAAQLFQLYARMPGHAQEALAQLLKAHELKPDQPRIVEALFNAAIQQQKWDLAEKMMNKAIELGMDPSGGHFYRGRLLAGRTDIENNFEKAIAEFQAGLDEFPTYSEGYVLLGRVLGRLERYEEAKRAFSRALELNPRSGLAALGLATLADRQGDEGSKTKYLNICAKTIPNHPWVRAELQALQDARDPQAGIARREQIRKNDPNDLDNLARLADLYTRQGQFDKAKEVYEAARQVDPTNLPLIQQYAEFLRTKTPPEPEAATQLLQDLIAKVADREPLYRATAQLLLATHMEALRRQNVPNAPDQEACDKAYEAAAEVCEEPAVRLDIGTYYQNAGRYDKAEHWYREALAAAEKTKNADADRKARKLIIDTLIQMRDPKREEDILKELAAFREKYDDPFALLAESEYHASAGRLNEALDSINRFLKQQPNSAVGIFKRADIRFQQSLWEQALADYRTVKALEPDGFNYEHRVRLALCQERLKDNDLAIAELLSVLEAEPNQESAFRELLRIYRKLRRWGEAEQLLTRRREKDPENLRLLYELLRVYRASDNGPKAAQIAEQIVEKTGVADGAVETLLETYLQFKKYDDVIRYVQNRVPAEKRGQAWILMPLATAHARKGETARALQLYNQALDTLGSHLPAFASAVRDIKRELGPQTTMQLFRGRLARNSDERGSKYALAVLQKEAGERDALVNVLEELLASAPTGDDPNARTERLFLLRTLALERQARNEPDQARARYEDMLKIDPYNIIALNNLAFLLMDHFNDPKAALPYSTTAAALVPQDPSVLDTVGWNMVLLGNLDGGIAALRKSIGLDDGLPTVHYHVAEALYMRSEKNESGRDIDLREASAECRRAHELIRAIGRDDDRVFDKIIELGKKLGLDLDPRLKTG